MDTKHHPLNVALPYFKVLLATEPYQQYCAAKKGENRQSLVKLIKIYPNLEDIWSFWGDIYCFDRRLNEVKYFSQWLDLNMFKFHKISFKKIQVVREGESFKAMRGTIYCTVSEKMDKKTAAQLYASTKAEMVSVANKIAGEYVLKLNKNAPFTAAKTLQYEREVDVIYWKRFLGLSSVQAAFKAYRKEKPAWDEFRTIVEKCRVDAEAVNVADLDRETMNTAVRSIDRFNRYGQKRINSLLNDDFSFPSEASPI